RAASRVQPPGNRLRYLRLALRRVRRPGSARAEAGRSDGRGARDAAGGARPQPRAANCGRSQALRALRLRAAVEPRALAVQAAILRPPAATSLVGFRKE